MSHQTTLVLSFMDFKQAFDSVDRRALAKILSLNGMQAKCIKVINAIYENTIAAVKVGNEFSSWLHVKSGIKHGCVLSPFIWVVLMDIVLERKNFPGFRQS